MTKVLNTIGLIIHGWIPVRTKYGWRWRRQLGITRYLVFFSNAIRIQREGPRWG